MASFTHIRVVSLPTQYCTVRFTLSSSAWCDLVVLDVRRVSTVAITQMVWGKVAIMDNLTYVLPVPRSLLQQIYGRATAEASFARFPQGRPLFNSRQCAWDFYSTDPGESSTLPHTLCCSDVS
jgi:hypothetical protein